MRIGGENVGRNGFIVLTVAAVGSVALAFHGYGHGISPNGSALAVTSSSTTSSGPSTTTSAPAPSTSSTKAKASPKASTSTTAPKLGPLLSSTQYASVAYRLYPSPASSRAKLATSGFNISVKLSGNNEVISVSVAGSSAPSQTSKFQKGDIVYFVETAFGDDSGNRDYSGGDDGIIVTNAQGRIVE